MSLSVLQGVSYLLPLVTLPYLVRVLGVDKFGLIAFAQAFIQYFLVISDFGFDLSATREIAINRNDNDKISEIFSSVLIIKSTMLIVCFIILLVLCNSVEVFRTNAVVLYYTFIWIIGQMFFTVWFFQGMETMKFITIFNVVAKLFFTVCIFIFIKDESDYIYVPLINGFGFLITGIFAMIFAIRCFPIRVYVPTIAILRTYFVDSSQFFLSRASVSLYTSSNAVVLGLFTNNSMVGYYSAAEKIYKALQMMYQPIAQALYPHVAKERNIQFFRKLFSFATACNVLLSVSILCLAQTVITTLFGEGLNESTLVLRIFAVTAIWLVPSILLGYPFLAALGYPKPANYSVIAGSVLHLLGLLFLLYTDNITIYSVATVLGITELFVFFVRVYWVRRLHLWTKQ